MTFPRKSFDLAHWKFRWKFKYITASMVSPYMTCKSFAVVRIENQWKKSTHYTLISRLINRLVLDYGKLDLERLILRSFYDLFFEKLKEENSCVHYVEHTTFTYLLLSLILFFILIHTLSPRQ